MMQNIELKKGDLSSEEYLFLRVSAGWDTCSETEAVQVLQSSVIILTARRTSDGQIVGITRVLGDGRFYFHVHDVLVRPSFRKLGLGKELIQAALEEIKFLCMGHKQALIGLMADKSLKDYYQKLGFQQFPNDLIAMKIWAKYGEDVEENQYSSRVLSQK